MQERIMSGLRPKVTNRKKDNKGFTLVELIVVIVILAILAALLIPALLGWIDKAKEEQYALEARNVYLAVQAEISEAYAKNSTTPPTAAELNNKKGEIQELADVTELSINRIVYKTNESGAALSGKEGFLITDMEIQFKSSNGNRVTATLDPNKSWTFN